MIAFMVGIMTCWRTHPARVAGQEMTGVAMFGDPPNRIPGRFFIAGSRALIIDLHCMFCFLGVHNTRE